ncbi:MAG: (deoxy)nucleoside triphosphate pyrophosphohydrolase [Sporomusaceae bacterium]|nr:(deoxy)nucleoside triphosphate pyrophosphohydrolase [Sporomusaceae bacterium]
MKKFIKVVGAIIENDQGEILCALRSLQMSLPNYWEFPGGKVETGETLSEAIEREIREELKCQVQYIEPFDDITHEYETFTINLITLKCKLVSGSPVATEHAKLIWLKRENLLSLNWAPADIPTIEKLAKEKEV